MHRLALLAVLVSSSARAELTAGAGIGASTDARFGARGVVRLAVGARISSHVTLTLPLELALLSYAPAPDARRTDDQSLTLVPEVAVGGDVTPQLRLAGVAGFGAGAVGDDDSCINLGDCDAYNHVVGLKLVGRLGLELRYKDRLWVRPVMLEQTWGGVQSLYLSSMGGVAF